MLFDPTERNVHAFLIPTRARAMKELVLALTIHDKDVTMAKPAQVAFIIRTGLTPPSEKCGAAKTHSLRTAAHHRGANPRTVSIPDKGSGSRQLAPLPQHQGCDSPPHTGKQWPALLSSLWPDSGASPVCIRTSARGITRD